MSVTALTTWYLEMAAPGDLCPAAAPAADAGVEVVRSEVASGQWARFLYTAVGADVAWTDRLPWSPERWQGHVEAAGRELWVAYERGTPAGYAELEGRDAGVVAIAYFGLLPDFRGRGIGGHLLSYGVERAWDLGGRWPGRPATRRVTVNTCSLDGPFALVNYQRRGFRVTRTTASQ